MDDLTPPGGLDPAWVGLISAAVGMLWARLWGAVFPTGWHFKFMERWLRKGNGTDQ